MRGKIISKLFDYVFHHSVSEEIFAVLRRPEDGPSDAAESSEIVLLLDRDGVLVTQRIEASMLPEARAISIAEAMRMSPGLVEGIAGSAREEARDRLMDGVRTILDRYDSILLPDAPARFCEPDPGTSPAHLRWMIEQIRPGTMPIDKLHRWLGFVQGTMIAAGYLTVASERDATRPLLNPARET
jgi:hypothetical protein